MALATGAAARHPSFGLPEPLPLHAQLRDADAVAIATVDAVGVGRIHLVEARSIVGGVPEVFEVKRAPSSPPGLAGGDRVLLLLRGARTPYLIATRAGAPIRIGSSADESDWVHGLRTLRAADGDPRRIANVYAGWLARGPALALQAAIGLSQPDCPEALLTPERTARLATLALEAEDPALRRAAARAAVRTADGRARLLARLPAGDPQVLDTTLRAAASADPERATRTLLRALRDPDAEVRDAALGASVALPYGSDVLAQISRIASDDPDARLRDHARRIVQARSRRDATERR